jgi:hypothetical protein
MLERSFYVAGILAIVIPFMRWIYNRLRNIESNAEFVQALAVTHLPHIFTALQAIADRVDVEIPEAPPIIYSHRNGKGGSDARSTLRLR